MVNKKRNFIRIAAASFAVVMLTGAFVLISTNVHADDETAAKKQLEACSVQQGSVIIKIGNTCNSGGEGCTSNPCQ